MSRTLWRCTLLRCQTLDLDLTSGVSVDRRLDDLELLERFGLVGDQVRPWSSGMIIDEADDIPLSCWGSRGDRSGDIGVDDV